MERHKIGVVHENNRTEELELILINLGYSIVVEKTPNIITARNDKLELVLYFLSLEDVHKICCYVGFIFLFGKNKNYILRATRILKDIPKPTLVISLEKDFVPNVMGSWESKARQYFATFDANEPRDCANTFIQFTCYLTLESLRLAREKREINISLFRKTLIGFIFLTLIMILSVSVVVIF